MVNIETIVEINNIHKIKIPSININCDSEASSGNLESYSGL